MTGLSNSYRRNILHYVAPAVLTNVCSFLFSVVDGLFVGNGVGTDALAAVNSCVPFVTISIALNMMASIGGVTIGAVRIGRGDTEGANQVFLHSVLFSFLLGVVLTLAGTLFTPQLATLLGAGETFHDMAQQYLFWWSLFIIPNFLSMNLQGFCRNDGAPSLVASATVAGTAVNVFLDWLFVYPLQAGVAGAAVATGASQVTTLVIILTHFFRRKGILRFKLFRPAKNLFAQISYRGSPEMIAQFSSPLMTLWMNRSVARYVGDLGVSAFSVISYISSLALSMLFGASEGMQPLLGQSFGAGKTKDVKVYFKSGMFIAVFGSAVIVALFCFFNQEVGMIFGAKGEVLAQIEKHILPFSWGFVLAGVSTMVSGYLYSTMHSKMAIALNIYRSFIAKTVFILGLPALFGSEIVWYSYGISEISVFVMALIMVRVVEKKEIRQSS